MGQRHIDLALMLQNSIEHYDKLIRLRVTSNNQNWLYEQRDYARGKIDKIYKLIEMGHYKQKSTVEKSEDYKKKYYELAEIMESKLKTKTKQATNLAHKLRYYKKKLELEKHYTVNGVNLAEFEDLKRQNKALIEYKNRIKTHLKKEQYERRDFL